MRKLLPLIGFGLILLSTSCQHEYSCDCVTTNTWTAPYNFTQTNHFSQKIKDTHRKAETECAAFNFEQQAGGGTLTISTTCELNPL